MAYMTDQAYGAIKDDILRGMNMSEDIMIVYDDGVWPVEFGIIELQMYKALGIAESEEAAEVFDSMQLGD